MNGRPPTAKSKLDSISRSVSLQMLTATPKQAPVHQEIYTEQLQPIRSPPKYFGFPVYSGPPQDPMPIPSDSDFENEEAETEATAEALAPPIVREKHLYNNVRKFSGDAAWAHTFSNDSSARTHGRIQSLPAKPRSEFEFEFDTALPQDFLRTLTVPSGRSGTYSQDSLRLGYISGSRSGPSATNLSRSQTPNSMRTPSRTQSFTDLERPRHIRKSSLLSSLGFRKSSQPPPPPRDE